MKSFLLDAEKFDTDGIGRRAGVLLDMKTYGRLREAEEALADVRAYDAARPKVMAELKAGHLSTLEDYRAKRSKAR